MADNHDLSEREIEILKLVAQGLSNKEIATQLFISINTVKVHLRNIFEKIGVFSRTEATLFAIEHSIVKSPGPEPEAETIFLPAPESAEPTRWQKFWKRYWWVSIPLGLILISGLATLLANSPMFAAPTPTPNPGQILTSAERWQELAPLPEARAGLAAAAYDNAIYAIAGETESGPSGLVERYDPQTDTWTRLSDKPTAVTHVSGVLLGEKIYVPGGELASGLPTDVLEVYDPRKDGWEAKASLPQAASGYALAAYEGQMYLFGGWDGEKALDIALRYDPLDDTWYPATPMPSARAYAGAAEAGGKIYVLGGWDGEKALDVNESYAPSRDREGEKAWEEESSMPEAEYAFGVESMAEMVFVVGESESSSFIFYEYIIQNKDWIILDELVDTPFSRYMSVTSQEGILFILGGVDETEEKVSRNVQYQAIYTISIPSIIK